MSETDTEEETEVSFKSPADRDRERSSARRMTSTGYASSSRTSDGQQEDRIANQSTNTSKIETDSAVQKMLSMQTQMGEVLTNLTSLLSRMSENFYQKQQATADRTNNNSRAQMTQLRQDGYSNEREGRESDLATSRRYQQHAGGGTLDDQPSPHRQSQLATLKRKGSPLRLREHNQADEESSRRRTSMGSQLYQSDQHEYQPPACSEGTAYEQPRLHSSGNPGHYEREQHPQSDGTGPDLTTAHYQHQQLKGPEIHLMQELDKSNRQSQSTHPWDQNGPTGLQQVRFENCFEMQDEMGNQLNQQSHQQTERPEICRAPNQMKLQGQTRQVRFSNKSSDGRPRQSTTSYQPNQPEYQPQPNNEPNVDIGQIRRHGQTRQHAQQFRLDSHGHYPIGSQGTLPYQPTLHDYHQVDDFPGQTSGDSTRYSPCYMAHRLPATRQAKEPHQAIKIPPFQGREDWKVWINRFEAIAERQGWDNDSRLDQLLPQLQGSAGDFVFTQLNHDTLTNYYALISEIGNRFRKVETPRTFAAQFSGRDQRQSETAEEYAAELKRLYDKAHRGRDHQTRQEDLVRRFLDGLKDDDLRCEVEYIKDPTDIDEAIYHVVNLIQTRQKYRRISNERGMKRSIRSTRETDSDDENQEYACQIQPKGSTHKQAGFRENPSKEGAVKREFREKSNNDVLKLILEQIKTLSPATQVKRPDIECFNCHKLGHIARECPKKRKKQLVRQKWSDRNTKEQGFKHGRAEPAGRGEAPVKSTEGQKHQANTGCPAKEHLVRRRKPYSDGLYVKGTIEGVSLIFTTDTGATKTIISKRIYNRIPTERRPELVKTACLKGAGGLPLSESGKAVFKFTIGPLNLERELMVADIEDEGLLGIDILQNDKKGPADILLSRSVIVLQGQEIPCMQVGVGNKIRKVTMADHAVIPPMSEAVLDVFIERTEEDDYNDKAEFIIEPTEHFADTYPLKMASVLVDINSAVTSKVRVLNPFPTQVSINQNAVIGQAQQIEKIQATLAQEEGGGRERRNMSVRRIEIEAAEIPVPKDPRIRKGSQNKVPEHLKELFERSTRGRSEDEKTTMAELLHEYQDTFSKDEWDLGLTNLAEHSINTGDATPIKQPPRRVPLAYQKEEKKAIEDLLKKGVIRKSTSPWASPIVLVRKSCGSIRPCVDYRRVNALVKPDGFPLPRVQDCLDAVAGAKLFSTFDLTSGYFQIPLKENDIPKSAFVCKFGQYEMLRMPFGLNNSASTFQRTMELTLQGLQWEICLIYIDDIIVFGSSFEEHMERVKQVLTRLKDAGLKLKPKKCEMLQHEVTFLGHVVSSKGVRPNPTNIAKVMDWPIPKSAKQVKQFVALASYYRRFVKNFAKIARPMIDLTKKGKEFLWSQTCQDSFESLKRHLTGAEIMGYPMEGGGSFILDVVASDVGIGGVLHQQQDHQERVIAFASRALNKAERNYCITEKELLAIRYFVEYFRQYLLGRKFIVRSDHQALTWLFKLKEPRGKIARWIEILSHYNFIVEYRPGKRQGHCDALSRCENPRDCECPLQDMEEPLKCGPCRKCKKRAQDMEHPDFNMERSSASSDHPTKSEPTNEKLTIRAVTNPRPGPSRTGGIDEPTQSDWYHGSLFSGEQSIKRLRKLQESDPDISPVLEAKQKNDKPPAPAMADKSPATRHYIIQWEAIEVKDGLLFKRFIKKNNCGDYLQFLVPNSMRAELLTQYHDCIVSGHLGCKKTYSRIQQRFYWFGMKNDVKSYVRQCDTCAANKEPNKKPKAPLGSVKTGAPWDVVATDYIGPLPVTDRGNRYILVLTDLFSKYVEVIAVPDQTAETCASRILNDFIARWGCPLSILSDQGRNYESNIFRELCRMLEMKKLRTSPRNPKCNGQAKRFNRTLIQMIRAYLCQEQKEWDQHLGCLAGAYRSTPNESTGLTPNLLAMGREVRLPAELVFGSNTLRKNEITSYGIHVDMLRSRMQRAHHVARSNLNAAAKRNKDIYDARLAHSNYRAGDVVWLLQERRKIGVAVKLQRAYKGPFLVKKNMNNIDFVIQMDKSGKEKLVHHDKLKPYEGTRPPGWIVRARRKQF